MNFKVEAYLPGQVRGYLSFENARWTEDFKFLNKWGVTNGECWFEVEYTQWECLPVTVWYLFKNYKWQQVKAVKRVFEDNFRITESYENECTSSQKRLTPIHFHV